MELFMTFEDAHSKAEELNNNGKHHKDWFYYAAFHDGGSQGKESILFGEWFVVRRPKNTPIRVAVYYDGSTGIFNLPL